MARPSLPRMAVRLYCCECGCLLAELDANTERLASVICRVRRAHALAWHSEHG